MPGFFRLPGNTWAAATAISSRDVELGILVTDRHQAAGLGTEILSRVIDVARHEIISRVVATTLSENQAMLALARRFHFVLNQSEDPAALCGILDLDLQPRAA